MARVATRGPWLAVALVAAAVVMPFPGGAHADEGVVLLVNATNPTSTVTASEARRAFTGGTKQWPHGAVVQVGVTATESAELRYVASLSDMTPRELLSRIQEQVFKVEMRKPVVLRSAGECIGLARANPGAICAATRPATLPPEVKVLVVRGSR